MGEGAGRPILLRGARLLGVISGRLLTPGRFQKDTAACLLDTPARGRSLRSPTGSERNFAYDSRQAMLAANPDNVPLICYGNACTHRREDRPMSDQQNKPAPA
jgi:hypothetical protein